MRQLALPNTEVMYDALLNRDPSFEGIFYVGVKTTGIFCRPTCRARKPKIDNIEFFLNTKAALDHGYRACKVCKPMQIWDKTPAWVDQLIREVHDDPAQNLKDEDLRARNLDPVKVRRWFSKNHGVTFHAYQRMVRLNHAFGKLQKGQKITETAYESGYESLSGFGEAFKKSLGFSPSRSSDQNIITVSRVNTPLGPMVAGATQQGIVLLEFSDRRMLETQIKKLKKYFQAAIVPGNNRHLVELAKQLREYFEGQRIKFDLNLEFPGTDFQRKVWQQLLEIPIGSTRSYAAQASLCGNSGAVRAVAKANGDNRISIIIPCHRVVGSDGSMTGYGGGIWRKKWLLDHERKMIQKLKKG
jgi:AraC family transcriptional regulator of adaptative response/methylated-DNA-[protein]-cysteine methyltransferase